MNHDGDYSWKVPLVPIPNTKVKLSRADNIWLETAREDKSLPSTWCEQYARFNQKNLLNASSFFIFEHLLASYEGTPQTVFPSLLPFHFKRIIKDKKCGRVLFYASRRTAKSKRNPTATCLRKGKGKTEQKAKICKVIVWQNRIINVLIDV